MAFNVKANKTIIKRNKYTLIPIVLVVMMLFILKSRIPVKDVQYTEQVTYNNMKYRYEEVIRASPFKFVRAGSVKEGKLVLLQRGDKKTATPDTIYIYEGSRRYLKYKIIR